MEENQKRLTSLIDELNKSLNCKATGTIEKDELKHQLVHDILPLFELIKLDAKTDEVSKQNFQFVREAKNKIKQLKNDIEWVPSQKETDQSDITDTPESLMEHGRTIQQQDQKSLESVIGVLHDTQDIGKQTAIKIDEQTEKMKKYQDNLFEIDDTLLRARKIIARMLRKTASSKTVWILILLIVVSLAIYLILKFK